VTPTPVGYLPGAGAVAVMLAARGPGACGCGAAIERGDTVVYSRPLGRVWCVSCADGLVAERVVPPWRA